MSFTRKEYKLQIMAPCFISSLLTFDESAFERRKNNIHIRIQNSIEAAMNESNLGSRKLFVHSWQ